MKTERLQEIISEEVRNMLEVSMTRKFRKAVEELQKVQLAQQQLRKKFVAEKNPKKKEKLKQDIIKMHKVVQKAESDFNSAIKAEPIDLDEAAFDNEGQMAKAQLERSMEYSKMIYDFMLDFGGDSDKLQFPAWVQSKLTKSMDYLQSVYNYLDGKDGLADDPAALRQKQSEGKLNEDVFKSFLADDPGNFKLYVANNSDKRKSVMARKTDRVWDDGVPVLKFIARAPKKPSPLPKGKFKIIEDNKYGWWYYQVGRTWYGISQGDYGTPPFEY